MRGFKESARGIMRVMKEAAEDYEKAFQAGDYKGAYLSAENFSAGFCTLKFTLTEWERTREKELEAPKDRQPKAPARGSRITRQRAHGDPARGRTEPTFHGHTAPQPTESQGGGKTPRERHSVRPRLNQGSRRGAGGQTP